MNNLFNDSVCTTEEREDDIVAAKNDVTVICAADVEITPPNWLVEGFALTGKATMFQGDGGCGKTSLAMEAAAAVSTGRDFAGHLVAKIGNVLILSGEDDGSALVSMLVENGANLNNCFIVENMSGHTLDSPKMEALIKKVKPILIIIDPIQAYLGAGINMDKANQTRPVLDRFRKLLEEHNCAVIFIAHTGKNRGEKARVNQALGSVDISASMRIIVAVEGGDNGNNQRTATVVKCSYGKPAPTIVYEIGENRGIHIIESCDIPVVSAENDPVYKTVLELATNGTSDDTYSYLAFNDECRKLTSIPAGNLATLRKKFAGDVGRLLKKEGIVVELGVILSGNKRGLRITRYCTQAD